MDKIFFEELDLPLPKYNLNVGSGNHGNQTGNILIKIEEVFMKEKPTHVLAQGDTNTVLAAAMAASKLNIKLGHIEAGLISYNRRMPEETNRIVTDNISDFLFAPTEKQRKILHNEGISEDKIFVVGNTIVDVVLQNKEKSKEKSDILGRLSLDPKKYFLVTAHRSLNVDIKENLIKLIESLKFVAKRFDFPLVYPIHPRTKKKIDEFGVDVGEDIILIEPVGYMDFICLEANAKLILTDSGGIQEEACILGVPCVTLRYDTERPESVEVGANMLAGLDKDRIIQSVDIMLKKGNRWVNPFGDGKSAVKIIDIIKRPE
jgi:UDP-N-acetylglucosamine 2-epimerase (non-hydrolysing)